MRVCLIYLLFRGHKNHQIGLITKRYMWHDVRHSLCGCVCVWVPVRESLCLFWRETPKKALCTRSPTRPEEGSQQKGAEEESRQERSVKRRTQSGEGSNRDQSTEQASQEMRVGQRGDQSTEVRKAKACSPLDARLTNARIQVSIPCGFVGVSRKYTPAIACKCTESCTKVSQTSPTSCVWS